MSSATPPTTRELAVLLGVSHTTVSLALRDHPSVSPDTRKRVQEAATKAGYRPNALVNALMSQVRQKHRLKPTGEVVAFMSAHKEGPDRWKILPSVVSQFEGVSERARELGFRVEPFWLGDRGSLSRQVNRVLQARNVRGAILSPLSYDMQTLALDWNRGAAVAIGYSFQQVSLHRAAHHQIEGAFACYSHLRNLGYQRIGLAISQEVDVRCRHYWSTGFLGSQWAHGGERTAPLLMSDANDKAAFLTWLDDQAPDAVIGIYPHQTLDWLRSARGNEIAYASLDIGSGGESVAGIQQDNVAVGAAAMNLLAGQLFRNETGIPSIPEVTLVEGTWIDGPTAPRKPTATSRVTPLLRKKTARTKRRAI
jgi:LacI family transcriptional regulator